MGLWGCPRAHRALRLWLVLAQSQGFVLSLSGPGDPGEGTQLAPSAQGEILCHKMLWGAIKSGESRRGVWPLRGVFGDWLGIALPGEGVSAFPGLLSFFFLFFPSPLKLLFVLT